MAGPNSGRSSTRTPVSRARRSAFAGFEPSRSFDSSPIPSAARPPPTRSPETRRTESASSRICRSVASSGSKPSCDTKRSARTSRSGSSAKLVGETVRRRRASRSARPLTGSTRSPVSSRRAIALTVKSRRRMSSSTDNEGSATISKSWRPGPVETSLRGGANSIPAGVSLRTLGSRGWSRMPTSRSATTRSSTRPCGARADRSPSVSSPGTRKSASFESSPSSSSRTAPPTRYASSPSPRTYFSISSRIRPFSPDRRSALQQCDRLELDERAGGELRHLYGRPRGRLLANVLRVDLVHRMEIVEALEEDRRLHEAVEPGARLREDRLQVREDLFGLLLDPARDHGVSRLQAELAGDEDEAAGRDGLRVRRALERRRRCLGPDDVLLGHGRASRLSHASASA